MTFLGKSECNSLEVYMVVEKATFHVNKQIMSWNASLNE